MSETHKAYLKSSVITFVATFASVIIVEIDSLTVQSFQDGAVMGLLFAGIRAGVKAVFTMLAGWKA